ncbi:Cysteine And Histidine-Rich Protein 1 [Manis pentadactyla]|nr:Cysteine And Histidine-Rich Protein 1 [Manis pentadactyla]
MPTTGLGSAQAQLVATRKLRASCGACRGSAYVQTPPGYRSCAIRSRLEELCTITLFPLELPEVLLLSTSWILKGMLDIPHEKPGEETKKTAKVFLLPAAKVLKGPAVGFCPRCYLQKTCWCSVKEKAGQLTDPPPHNLEPTK